MTEVHAHHRPLDNAAPVVLVAHDGRVDAALDSNRPELASDLLAVLLMSRYGSGWTLAPAAS